jgi:predicted regulator of Ras-like GTPase activity (Roadblock/LC7/MglB family)
VTVPSAQSASDAGRFGWLLTNFVEQVAGISYAVVVSSDGLLLTSSAGLPRDRADQLAGVASGLSGLTRGAARVFGAGEVLQTVVEMELGCMLLMAIADGSCLAVLASPDCDMGLVAYEMTLLVDRAGELLTPELRTQLLTATN